MRKPTCVLSIRSDLLAVVCSWCPEEKLTRAGTTWAENRGYNVSHGLCEGCEAREFPFMAEWKAAKREGREPVYSEPLAPPSPVMQGLASGRLVFVSKAN
jgi:hypothetical protein